MCGVHENAAPEEVLNGVNIICDGSAHIPLTKQKTRTVSLLLPNMEWSYFILKNWNKTAPF
jgi:hypothetical protein